MMTCQVKFALTYWSERYAIYTSIMLKRNAFRFSWNLFRFTNLTFSRKCFYCCIYFAQYAANHVCASRTKTAIHRTSLAILSVVSLLVSVSVLHKSPLHAFCMNSIVAGVTKYSILIISNRFTANNAWGIRIHTKNREEKNTPILQQEAPNAGLGHV